MLAPDSPPRLYDADGDITKTWYIDYRIWNTDKGAFVRKRYEGMNKYKTLAERRRVAKKKMAEIKELLAAGYTAGEAPVADIGIDGRTATVKDAVEFVLRQKERPGRVGERHGEDYQRLLNRLKDFALAAMPLLLVKPGHVLAFMQHLEKRVIEAKSYNSYRDTLSAVFNFLVKLEVVERNPVRGVERRKVVASDKHQPYTEAQRQLITAEVQRQNDGQLLLFISFIYYCFIRSGGELRLLRVRDIQAETVRVPGGTAKNSKAEHVAIPRQLEALIQANGLRDYPGDYYVFTKTSKPGTVPVGKNWFARRHRTLLDAVGISGEHTVYGYKHTGAVNLYLATKDIELVRRHCRHAHAGITATYLRGLGAMHDGKHLDQMPDF